MPFEFNSAGVPFDTGLLTPVSTGYDSAVCDAVIFADLIQAEVALTRAWGEIGLAPSAAVSAIVAALEDATGNKDALARVCTAAWVGGNPVIPLVTELRDRVPAECRRWVHTGATSQDILDTALMRMCRRAAAQIGVHLCHTEQRLSAFGATQRDAVVAARTLTQHAVPTTLGARVSGWLRGIRRAHARLTTASTELPAQLGGAAGTLAAAVELAGQDAAARLSATFAGILGLAVPEAPWHTQRWPVTEFADALVQVVDALAKVAADVATLSRTEIGEITEAGAGGSSAMPQKQNPARSVLLRSAGLRAPHLAASLHAAAAMAVDERPDGAWHAEWPALRELARLSLGAAATASELAGALRFDADAAARNLELAGGLLIAERVQLVLGPPLGADRVRAAIGRARDGGDLASILRDEAAAAGVELGVDFDALLDPAAYTGLAAQFSTDLLAAHDESEGTP